MLALATACALMLAAPAAEHYWTCGEAGSAEIRDRGRSLRETAGGEPVRKTALDALRAATAGPPRERATRDAAFCLARHLRPEEQVAASELTRLLKTASVLYRDDPRAVTALYRLAGIQLDDGETLAAHFSLTRLLERSDGPTEPSLLARAAANALTVGDPLAAHAWSVRFDPALLARNRRVAAWRVRLIAAQSQERHPDALEAIEALAELAPAALRRDAQALLAAARTEAAVGQNESAAARYEAFVNIHPRAPERPAAMLEAGRLLMRLQRRAAADRMFSWILSDHPEAPEADRARLERIEIDEALTPLERAEAYRRFAATADLDAAQEACRRILEELIADGKPLEAISILGWMTRHTRGRGALAARKHLIAGIAASTSLIVARGDEVEIAAAVAELDAVGLPLPAPLTGAIEGSRARLGLAPRRTAGDPTARQAEELWRAGREAEALERIAAGLALDPPPAEARRLQVLHADIRYAAGETAAACAGYRDVARLASSSWVAAQLERCDRRTESGEESPS